MKTIAIFTGYYIPHLGGVERYTDKLAAQFRSKGNRVVIVTFNHDPANLREREVDDTLTVYRLPAHGFLIERYPLPKYGQAMNRLLAQLETEEVDFVIANTRFHLTSLIGSRFAKKHSIPALLIEHGTSHFTVGNKVLDWFGAGYEHVLTRIIKRRIKSFYGVSKACGEWLGHFGISADGVLYNAIDPADKALKSEKFDDAYPRSKIVVSFAGRLISEKGVMNLIEAFKIVRHRQPEIDMCLVVAGGGPLQAQIERLSDGESMHFVGKLGFSDVLSLFDRSDIFVHPSLYPEGMPTAILEAALMECAIVATPRGGTEEIIPDSSYGTIISGTVQSLAEAIEDFVVDSGRRKSCGKLVKKRAETVFNWASVADSAVKEMGKRKSV
jgi:glycosyltransferase involved in cell wall biosynthesis